MKNTLFYKKQYKINFLRKIVPVFTYLITKSIENTNLEGNKTWKS